MNHYVLEAMDNGAAMARPVIRLIENVLVDYSHGDCRSPWQRVQTAPPPGHWLIRSTVSRAMPPGKANRGRPRLDKEKPRRKAGADLVAW